MILLTYFFEASIQILTAESRGCGLYLLEEVFLKLSCQFNMDLVDYSIVESIHITAD